MPLPRISLRRALPVLLVAAAWLLPALPGAAQEDRRVEVVEMRGPLDGRILDFAADSIERAADAGVEVVVLELDSPGVTGDDAAFGRLLRLVADPPVPVAVWVGPAPAVAYGGAYQLAVAAPFSGVAPGSEVGHAAPTIAGDRGSEPIVEVSDTLRAGTTTVGQDPPPGLDVVQPSLKQFVILDLDGLEMEVGGERVTLSTVVPFTAEGGGGVTNLPTVIREPNVWDQFLRLATTPDAAFFLLVAGLTVAAFEFYAIGPGVAAAVAAVSLFLAGYGMASLPIRWWAIVLTLLAIVALAAAHQMGGVALLSALGVVALAVAGFNFTDAAPQIVPGAAGVLLTVAGAAFFFLLAMPTVSRSRFSTRTIGRARLIGKTGKALSAFAPDGEIEVEGARWRATAHREAAIQFGDPVVVTGVDGWYLEVEPSR